MRRLVLNSVKTFYIIYVVMIYSVNNLNIFGFTLSHNSLS
jgi:hypothetical protein